MDIGFACQGLASITTFIAIWRMGDKAWDGPVWGLVSQVPWFGMIIFTPAWGILPLTLAMCFLYLRAIWKWRQE